MKEEKHPSKVEAAIERLNQDPYLLAAITAIPYVGGSITQVITGIGQEIAQERNRRLFQQLSGHLEALDERAIKKDYFDTPKGFDLLVKALDESRRTRSEEKRDFIARVLRGAVVNREQTNYSPEEYLYLISDLTPQELTVARLMHKGRPEIREAPWDAWQVETCTTVGIDRSDLQLALDRLGSTGLVRRVTSGNDGGGFWIVSQEYGAGDYYTVTPAFDRLMKFLRLET
jgi:hypothetical protein